MKLPGFALLAVGLILVPPANAQRGLKAADAKPRPKGDDGIPEAIGGGGGLIVGGVRVDTGGKTPTEARLAGWREAQRLAWPALWARMSGLAPGTAPALADSALDSIVSAIEVEREEIGPTRYIAQLAVVFDRARASTYLGRYAALVSSPPLLLLPVLQDAATRLGHEPQSPWLAAWARLRAGETPVDYVRIRPAPGDTVLLNAWQAERRHLFLWRMLVDRYQVADVLIPELILERSFLGGPVAATLIVRFGPSGRELGRVRLTNGAGDVDGLLDTAVREADRIYVAALRAGNLLPDPSLLEADEPPEEPMAEVPLVEAAPAAGIQLRVATPDDATLQAIQRAAASAQGVRAVRLQSFVLGGESVLEISTSLSLDELGLAFDAVGLRLEGTALRRRAAGEAPLAAPPEPPPEPAGPTELLPPP
jgi:hypothetical protein